MWVATPFGLAKCMQMQEGNKSPAVQVDFQWNGIGFLQRKQVQTTYDFPCTCFTAKECHFKLNVDLSMSLKSLKEMIIQHLEMNLYVENIVVLQPTMGKHHQLEESHTSCIFESLRPLLIVVMPGLTIDKVSSLLHVEEIKPSSKVENPTDGSSSASTDTLTVVDTNDDKVVTSHPKQYVLTADTIRTVSQIVRGSGCALGPDGFLSSGRKYWEIQLETSDLGDGVLLGIANTDISINSSVVGSGMFYGYAVHQGKKISHSKESYGEICCNGDVVGVLVDVDESLLSFYRNGRSLGVAFRNLSMIRMRPVISLTHVGLKVKLLPSPEPPNVEVVC